MSDYYTKPDEVVDGHLSDASDVNNIADATEAAFDAFEADFDADSGSVINPNASHWILIDSQTADTDTYLYFDIDDTYNTIKFVIDGIMHDAGVDRYMYLLVYTSGGVRAADYHYSLLETFSNTTNSTSSRSNSASIMLIRGSTEDSTLMTINGEIYARGLAAGGGNYIAWDGITTGWDDEDDAIATSRFFGAYTGDTNQVTGVLFRFYIDSVLSGTISMYGRQDP